MINDGCVTKHVTKIELQSYLDLGWTFGHTAIYKQKLLGHTVSSVARKKISDATIGRFKGCIRIYKDSSRLIIKPEELDHYIGLGYKRGFGERQRVDKHPNAGKVKIEKDNIRKYILLAKLNSYLDNGWIIINKKLRKEYEGKRKE